jgi:PPOX class probable F420-dependent enzyme
MPTIPDSHRDLIEAPGTASLSTVGTDGMPQVTALWYLADGDTVKTSMVSSRQKYKNLIAHPKGTLFIVDPANPFRTLEVRADASFEADHDLALLERIVRHYGHDPDNFPAAQEGRESRVVLTLTPIHVVATG